MESPQWSESYNCHKLRLGAVSINVNWNSMAPQGSPAGYVVSVSTGNGTRSLKRLFTNLDEGKRAGVRLAQKVLAESQSAMDEYISVAKEMS